MVAETGVRLSEEQPNISVTLANFVSATLLAPKFLSFQISLTPMNISKSKKNSNSSGLPLLSISYPIFLTFFFDQKFFDMLPHNNFGNRFGYAFERWHNKDDSNCMNSKLEQYLNSVEATPICHDAQNWKLLRQLSLIALGMLYYREG